jgi:hypothetical protein
MLLHGLKASPDDELRKNGDRHQGPPVSAKQIQRWTRNLGIRSMGSTSDSQLHGVNDMAIPSKSNHASNLRISGKPISLAELEALCDDPQRDLAGGVNVRAVLTFVSEKGFYLAAHDGNVVHQVVDGGGNPLRFRTIEAALEALQHLPGLDADIGLVHGDAMDRRH